MFACVRCVISHFVSIFQSAFTDTIVNKKCITSAYINAAIKVAIVNKVKRPAMAIMALVVGVHIATFSFLYIALLLQDGAVSGNDESGKVWKKQTLCSSFLGGPIRISFVWLV